MPMVKLSDGKFYYMQGIWHTVLANMYRKNMRIVCDVDKTLIDLMLAGF